MSSSISKPTPSDQAQREQALNPANSILVQAPAGSGKTDLLTRRFLRLLVEVEDPAHIVAITFTKAAAAEMRHRILTKLEQAATSAPAIDDPTSMEALAYNALVHSQALGWNLLDQPAQLRISTIDSFCREIALQQPLLSGLGDGIDISEHPEELYRHAARRTIQQIDAADSSLRSALEQLLEWRDNNWNELEKLLASMLASRDRWIHEFVVGQQQDWDALRRRLERPFANAVHAALDRLRRLLDQLPEARDEALALIRFACENGGDPQLAELAELAEFPGVKIAFDEADLQALEDACRAHNILACFLLTNDGAFRTAINKTIGFPPERRFEKARLTALIQQLRNVDGLEAALAEIRKLPPLHYSENEWQIVRACFALLRNALGQLRVVFAEAGAVDYVEVAQIAESVLQEDGLPSETAISLAGNIHHILVDEFQDTSRRQHELLRRLIAAWTEREGRSCFVVGDPMQSIYFFRDADAELFPRVRIAGLEIQGSEPLKFEPIQLKDNFRTDPMLIARLNEFLGAVFEENDGSGIDFAAAEPARSEEISSPAQFKLHLKFTSDIAESTAGIEAWDSGQVAEVVALIQSHQERMQRARENDLLYRIAVLGRTRAVLAPVAEALRQAGIPFRAVDLEKLSSRAEVLDVLSLGRALLNPFDRIAWLGVLRAPWCGLSLADLHALTSGDDPSLLASPVPELLSERIHLLSAEGRAATQRLLGVLALVPAQRFAMPSTSLGTLLQSIWQSLGGDLCVDATARGNLELLWKTLDKLPNREADLLGTNIAAALDKLTAQPDPEAKSECGVQLLTIHKAKGLEFEVVIVPELQAATRRGSFKLLTWLERGIPPEQRSYDSDEVTEFLVAPLQAKGSDRSTAKSWVDCIYAERESQEMRRLLYVASTRARNELHLFAQPPCKLDRNGDWKIQVPAGTLLATAWPGLRLEVEQQFEEWKTTRAQAEPEGATIDTIAAQSQGNLFEIPGISEPIIIRRLPPDLRIAPKSTGASTAPVIDLGSDDLYERHEGGLRTRALGIAVHSLLEQAAQMRKDRTRDDVRNDLPKALNRIATRVRSAGLDLQQSREVAAQAIQIALQAANDPTGQWILSPSADAQSEIKLAGIVDHEIRSIQVDRIFRAGRVPLSNEGECWWIIDYKTAHPGNLPESNTGAILERLRPVFAPQLRAYADVLRKLHGKSAKINAGLYYPRMLLFDWWEI